MKSMKWNKLSVRPLDNEEKEYYKDSKIDFIWDGGQPEIDEEVLAWTPRSEEVFTDIWIEYEDGVCFENTDNEVIYWMSFPEPPEIKEDK